MIFDYIIFVNVHFFWSELCKSFYFSQPLLWLNLFKKKALETLTNMFATNGWILGKKKHLLEFVVDFWADYLMIALDKKRAVWMSVPVNISCVCEVNLQLITGSRSGINVYHDDIASEMSARFSCAFEAMK